MLERKEILKRISELMEEIALMHHYKAGAIRQRFFRATKKLNKFL